MKGIDTTTNSTNNLKAFNFQENCVCNFNILDHKIYTRKGCS